MLILTQPAGLEGYFRAMSSPAKKLELPPREFTYSTSDLEHAVRIGEEYGIRFLSPDQTAEQLPLYAAALNIQHGSK